MSLRLLQNYLTSLAAPAPSTDCRCADSQRSGSLAKSQRVSRRFADSSADLGIEQWLAASSRGVTKQHLWSLVTEPPFPQANRRRRDPEPFGDLSHSASVCQHQDDSTAQDGASGKRPAPRPLDEERAIVRSDTETVVVVGWQGSYF